jgi:MFS family permease
MRGEPLSATLWTKEFLLISLTTFFLFFSFQMLMPTLPTYVQALGARESIVGLVTGLFAASALLVRPFAGRELDRRGRRGVYQTGLVAFALAVLAYRWAGTPAAVLAIRLVHGAAWGLTTTASGTIVTDLVSPERRGEGLGYYGMFINLAMAVAPAAGLYIAYHYQYPPLFYASGALAATAWALSHRLPKDPLEERTAEARRLLDFFERRAWYPAVLTLLVSFAHASIVTFLQLYARHRGVANVGPFFTVQALTVMMVRPLAGRTFDRRGPAVVIIPGMGLLSVALVVLSQASTLAWFLVGGVLYGLGMGATLPGLQALSVAGVPADRRGAANATYFSALDLGIGLGGISLGAVADYAGFPVLYLTAAAVVLAGLAIFVVFPPTRHRRQIVSRAAKV